MPARFSPLIIFCVFLVCGFSQQLKGQPLPIGNWRSHATYHNVHRVHLAGERVYAGTPNSLFYAEDNAFGVHTKVNELSEALVSALGYGQGLTVIGYTNGNVDWYDGKTWTNLPVIKQANLSNDKTIHDIFFQGDTLYLATGLGMVLFNLATNQVVESWLQLGEEATSAGVYRGVIRGDSIFIATSQGLMANSLDLLVNRLDWTTWDRVPLGTLSETAPILHLAQSSEGLYADTGNATLYRFSGKNWNQDRTFPAPIRNVRSGQGDHLLVCTADSLYVRSTGGNWQAYGSEDWQQLNDVREDESGTFWLGDAAAGLVRGNGTNWESGYPSGPPTDLVSEIGATRQGAVAVPGGFSASSAQNQAGMLFAWNGTEWQTTFAENAAPTITKDWASLAVSPSRDSIYVASYGNGLAAFPASNLETARVFDTTQLDFERSTAAPYLRFTDVAYDVQGNLWIAQRGAAVHLYRRTPSGEWTSFVIPDNKGAFIQQIKPTLFGTLALAISSQVGGGLLFYDPETNEVVEYGTTQGLPGSVVLDMEEDQNGFLWVSGADGLAVFTNVGAAISETIVADRPRVDFREAFVGVPVNGLALDGGNRLWLATSQGAWLLDGLRGGIVHQFNAENSPLPVDQILHVAHVPSTGEVYFATAAGMMSYQSDAPEASSVHSTVKVFPNPVTPDYDGLLAVQGMPRNGILRITDAAGHRIKEVRANGNTATWDLRDLYGQRVPAGVYLLVTSSISGEDNVVSRVVIQE